MASPLHTLPENEKMGDVIEMMKARFFRRVPITDSFNRLSGIVNLVELQGAMNEVLEKRQLDLEEAVRSRTKELQEANARLEELSLRDGLTGLLNRRAMTEKLEALHALAARYGNTFSLILCDIDHFKRLNDSMGHLHGDTVLRSVSSILSESVRVSDYVYRYGGEEFLIALPETDIDGARWVAERMRSAVEMAAFTHPESTTSDVITVSFGIAETRANQPEQVDGWAETIERADRALYQAKSAGRNRVFGDKSDE